MMQIIGFIFLLGFMVLLVSVGIVASYITKLITTHKTRHRRGIGKYFR